MTLHMHMWISTQTTAHKKRREQVWLKIWIFGWKRRRCSSKRCPQRYMSETSRNWDFSRLAYMDVVIMQIAIAEMLTFPNIPVSVTINEYVDLAKLYSTYKSGGYINGMLDAIARYLIDSGRMMKAMGGGVQPEPSQEEF